MDIDDLGIDQPQVAEALTSFHGKTIAYTNVFILKDKVQIVFTDETWIQIAGGQREWLTVSTGDL